MPLTIPNAASATYAPQAQVDKLDWDIVVAGSGLTGVVSGCAVTASSGTNVSVAAGVVRIAGRRVAVTSGTLACSPDAGQPRFYLISVNTSGTKAAEAGSAASSPTFPDVTAAYSFPPTKVILAAVYVPAGAVSLAAGNINDRRVPVLDPGYENVKWYGATGDGTTNDTTAFTDALAVIDAVDPPPPLVIPAGKYLIPNGLATTTPGLRVIGLGYNRTVGGGSADNSSIGSYIVTTAAGAWCWTHTSPTAPTTNNLQGARFENIGFRGDADTAGGLKIGMFCNNYLDHCLFENHTTGSGLQTGNPTGGVSGGDTSWSEALFCGAQNCKIGFDIGYGDFTNGVGAADWLLIGCYQLNNSAGGIVRAAGTVGFRLDTAPRIEFCKAEGAETGYLIKCGSGFVAVAPRAEACTTGFHLYRGTNGTATGGTTTTLVHTGAGWETNRWAGQRLTFISGPGAGQTPTIISNTSDTLTFAAQATAPTSATVYRVAQVNASRNKLITPVLSTSTTTGIIVSLNQNADALIGYDNAIGTTLLTDNGTSTRLML